VDINFRWRLDLIPGETAEIGRVSVSARVNTRRDLDCRSPPQLPSSPSTPPPSLPASNAPHVHRKDRRFSPLSLRASTRLPAKPLTTSTRQPPPFITPLLSFPPPPPIHHRRGVHQHGTRDHLHPGWPGRKSECVLAILRVAANNSRARGRSPASYLAPPAVR
jgi:hypothetical protein